jgi:hypothetical protein
MYYVTGLQCGELNVPKCKVMHTTTLGTSPVPGERSNTDNNSGGTRYSGDDSREPLKPPAQSAKAARTAQAVLGRIDQFSVI